MRELYEKIYSGKYKASRDARDTINLFMPSAVAVDAENVSDWVEQTKPSFDDLFKFMPHRLPFQSMWFEWSATNVHEDNTETPGTIGALVFEVHDYNKENQHEDYEKVPLKGIMILVFLHDQSLTLTLIVGNATYNEDFTDIHYGSQYQTPEAFNGTPDEIAESYCLMAVPVVTSCLCFFNCKNIEVRKIQASLKKQRKNNRLGIPTPEFHVIEVHKKTVQNIYEGGISKSGTVHHASLVRGHFKTYTEDSKLFGKKTGTWFWESHVRGDIGIPTVNDYKVYEPRHKGKCVQ